jgi:hypothetical protein
MFRFEISDFRVGLLNTPISEPCRDFLRKKQRRLLNRRFLLPRLNCGGHAGDG